MHLCEEPVASPAGKLTARQKRDTHFHQLIADYYATNDEAPLGQLLDQTRPWLERYLRYRGVFRQQHLEEAIQETLLRALLALRERRFKLGVPSTFFSWASTSSWYRFVDLLAAQDKAGEPGYSEDPFRTLADEEDPAHLERQEIAQKAAGAIEAATKAMLALDDSARAVFAAFYYRGMGQAEVCAHLGITIGAFQSALQRGLKGMRTWAKQNPHLTPTAEMYEALRSVDSGTLFDDGSLFERATKAKQSKLQKNRTPESRKAEKARAKDRAQLQAAERQRLATEYDEPQYAMAA